MKQGFIVGGVAALVLAALVNSEVTQRSVAQAVQAGGYSDAQAQQAALAINPSLRVVRALTTLQPDCTWSLTFAQPLNGPTPVANASIKLPSLGHPADPLRHHRDVRDGRERPMLARPNNRAQPQHHHVRSDAERFRQFRLSRRHGASRGRRPHPIGTAMITVTSTTLNVANGVLTASVVIEIGNGAEPVSTTPSFAEADLRALAAKASPPREDYTMADVITATAEAFGVVLPATLPPVAEETEAAA